MVNKKLSQNKNHPSQQDQSLQFQQYSRHLFKSEKIDCFKKLMKIDLILVNIGSEFILCQSRVNQFYMGCTTYQFPQKKRTPPLPARGEQVQQYEMPDNLFKEEICSGYCPEYRTLSMIMVNQEKLIKGNKRMCIEKNDEYPYSAIGMIEMQFDKKRYTGSGFLIGKDTVLTCAHNCYHEILQEEAENIVFCPAKNGQKGQKYSVKSFYFPEQYKKKQSEELDFAVLKLSENVGEQYGYFGVNFRGGQAKTVYVYGYPGGNKLVELEDYEQIDIEHKLCGSYAQAVTDYPMVDSTMIRHKVSTTEGQSGSPIFIIQKQKAYVVGIHTSADEKQQQNKGVRLTKRVQTQINQMLTENFYLNSGHKFRLSMLAENKKQCSQLKRVNLNKTRIRSEGLKFFSQINLPVLSVLLLNSNNISEDGVVYIVVGTWPSLTYLSLSNNRLKSGLKNLSKGNWPKLEYLNLDENQLTSSSIDDLSLASWNIKKLSLAKNKLDFKGVDSLIKLEWPSLQQLNLERSFQSNCCSLKNLYRNKWKNLTYLNLSNNEINESSAEGLAKCEWNSLKRLKLKANKLSKGLSHFKQAKWPSLQELNLSNNQIDSLNCKSLIQISWPKLKLLNLSKNTINDQRLDLLQQNQNFPQLVILDLSSNIISKNGISQLQKQKLNKTLKFINLRKNVYEEKTSEQLRKILKSRFPGKPVVAL